MNAPIFIQGFAAIGLRGTLGSHIPATDDAVGHSEEAMRKLCGPSLRQGSHFVVLAAAGALLCTRQIAVLPETALYFASGLGDVIAAANLFQKTQGGSGRPSPFDFINVNTNTAAFHIARLIGLSGRNFTITQSELSFEWALRLAGSDMGLGGKDALVGGVDERHPHDPIQQRRLTLAPDQQYGEGSAWLYLRHNPTNALGCLLQVSLWPQASAVPDLWARDVAAHIADICPMDGLQILPGFRVDAKQRTSLAAHLPNAVMQPYLEHCGCFHTAAAFAIAWALHRPRQKPEVFAHVTRDTTGHNGLILFTAEPNATRHAEDISP